MKIYSIRDKKINYGEPFRARNDAEVVRSFTKVINTPGNNYHDYCDDQELWQVGEFDNETGKIKEELKFICSGTSVKIYEKEVTE